MPRPSINGVTGTKTPATKHRVIGRQVQIALRSILTERSATRQVGLGLAGFALFLARTVTCGRAWGFGMTKSNDLAQAGRKPRRVAMLIYSGVTPMDVAGPLEVFSFANVLRKEILYDVVTVAPTAGPVTTKAGVGFMPSCAMADLELPIDTLMVSGGMRPRNWVTPEMIDWLRGAAPQARRFGSICTGAFLLGAAGLLDGRRVTTHWASCVDLAQRHPAACVEVDPIFIREGGFFSTAGISAGIDLALALVEEDHGREFALHIARYLVLYLKRSGGQAQYSTHLRMQVSEVPAIERVQTWCLDNPGGDLRASTLREIAGMSERDFSRKFRQEAGQTVVSYVTSVRMDTACRLLAETGMPVKVVAVRSGFGSTASLRRAFQERFGVTPARYRENFSA
jgi:transcriptional regulator GlxA family with amidase domain